MSMFANNTRRKTGRILGTLIRFSCVHIYLALKGSNVIKKSMNEFKKGRNVSRFEMFEIGLK